MRNGLLDGHTHHRPRPHLTLPMIHIHGSCHSQPLQSKQSFLHTKRLDPGLGVHWSTDRMEHSATNTPPPATAHRQQDLRSPWHGSGWRSSWSPAHSSAPPPPAPSKRGSNGLAPHTGHAKPLPEERRRTAGGKGLPASPTHRGLLTCPRAQAFAPRRWWRQDRQQPQHSSGRQPA